MWNKSTESIKLLYRKQALSFPQYLTSSPNKIFHMVMSEHSDFNLFWKSCGLNCIDIPISQHCAYSYGNTTYIYHTEYKYMHTVHTYLYTHIQSQNPQVIRMSSSILVFTLPFFMWQTHFHVANWTYEVWGSFSRDKQQQLDGTGI